MKEKLKALYLLPALLLVLLLGACTSLVDVKTPLGVTLRVDETAEMDTISPQEVTLHDSWDQVIRLRRFDRSSLTDADIGHALLDSARNAGYDLKSVEPGKIANEGLAGAYLIGKGHIIGMFIGRGTTQGYIIHIDYDDQLSDEAKDVMRSMALSKH